MAAIMANDEQAPNHKASGQTAQRLGPPSLKVNGASDQREPKRKIDRQQHKGMPDGALGQGNQPFTDDFAMGKGLSRGNGLFDGAHEGRGRVAIFDKISWIIANIARAGVFYGFSFDLHQRCLHHATGSGGCNTKV